VPRVKIGPALPDPSYLGVEIARFRDLDLEGLRGRWHTELGRAAPPHLPRHLLLRILVYRLQVARWGDLDRQCQHFLDRSDNLETAGQRAADRQGMLDIQPGTVLAREWKGRMQRVAVLADGFAWNGKTYSSLSKVALVITGTRWNGPRFFGLRDKRVKEPSG
jgi:Protein of unknown function (DUF2924)